MNVRSIMKKILKIIFEVISELFFQTLINMAYCCLVLFGKLIQKIVFGQLRVMEQQVVSNIFLSTFLPSNQGWSLL